MLDDVVKGIGGEYTGNYTGPYWSNGKIQSSVEWGDKDPTSALDYLSRQHDSAYARWNDSAHREAADRLYNEGAQKLAARFPQLAGNLVLYGNYAKRSAERTGSNFLTGMRVAGLAGGLGGLIYTAAGNIIDANKMINGTYLSKETNDVKEYFKTDPYKKQPPKSGHDTYIVGGKLLPKGKVELLAPVRKNKVEPQTPARGPTVNVIKKAELVANQARRFENYQKLYDNAKNEIPIVDWRTRIKSFRRNKKKNKLYPLHI